MFKRPKSNFTKAEEREIIRQTVLEYLENKDELIKDTIAVHITNGLMANELRSMTYDIKEKVTQYLATKMSRVLIRKGRVEKLIDEDYLKSQVTATLLQRLI